MFYDRRYVNNQLKISIMGIIKVQCPCGMLWLSETFGGYDTICDHDGKICGAVNYQDEQFQIIQPETTFIVQTAL
jgi:hypothetical protein